MMIKIRIRILDLLSVGWLASGIIVFFVRLVPVVCQSSAYIYDNVCFFSDVHIG